MRKLSWIVAIALMAIPMTAEAGFIIEGSVGSGFLVKPDCCNRTPTNLMLSPGYGFGEMLRAELGIVADLGDIENADPALQLRPMLVFDPPIIPFYGRLIIGLFSPFDSDKREWAYGGALGIGFSLFGLGMFAEAGYIPVGNADTQLFEGRLGGFYAF